jgi:uncharacterized Zn ribbon protein
MQHDMRTCEKCGKLYIAEDAEQLFCWRHRSPVLNSRIEAARRSAMAADQRGDKVARKHYEDLFDELRQRARL